MRPDYTLDVSSTDRNFEKLRQVTSDGKTAVTGSQFKNEALWIFRFDGEKILSIKEFMDSKYALDTAAAENAAAEKK